MASKRGYTTPAEVNEMIGTTPTDLAITKAEEWIDSYVGFQKKFLRHELKGLLAQGGVNNLRLEDVHQNNMQIDYLKGCWIEIIGGTGSGQRKKITGQTFEGIVTLESDLSTATDTTSYYRIYQLGKFPRQCDSQFDGSHTPQRFYKSIPEQVREATIMQVEFMAAMGDDFFSTDKADFQSEHIGDYSYSKGNNTSKAGISSFIAPKARSLLRGIINRVGSF